MFGLFKSAKSEDSSDNRLNNKLSTESYKGVRDFYPEDQAILNYIFRVMKTSVEAWGYIEYGASILEPAELYKAKTSEEIVNDQTYTFKDRGDREVTLRPEMTPTVARMIAAKVQELPKPIRWYSIPNVFRYEKPQKGRLREHYQLNVDFFGPKSATADAEVISIAADIMEKFGASQEMYEIRINSRELINDLYKILGVVDEKQKLVTRLIDKKDKIKEGDFFDALKELLGNNMEEKAQELKVFLDSPANILEKLKEEESSVYVQNLMNVLFKRGIKNIVLSPTVTRGFDYYTGVVFEIFDKSPENARSIFGGGRYDELLKMFGKEELPAVGFGLGDLTIRNFLETHDLLPKSMSTTNLWICTLPDTDIEEVYKIASELRASGINVGVDLSGKKIGDQIAAAEKRNIALIIAIGNEEISSNKFNIKRLADKLEKSSDRANLASSIKELIQVG